MGDKCTKGKENKGVCVCVYVCVWVKMYVSVYCFENIEARIIEIAPI